MLLESTVIVCDPYKRNISLEEVTGNKTSWVDEDGLLIARLTGPWVSIQGPDGWLDRFNKLGLVNPKTMEPYIILSQREYNKQIAQTCIVS